MENSGMENRGIIMDNKLYKLMNWPRVEGIIYSEENSPFEILGPHPEYTGSDLLAGCQRSFSCFRDEKEADGNG